MKKKRKKEVDDPEEQEFYCAVEVEGEEASSGPLVITEEVKRCFMIEIEDVHFNHDSAVLLPMAYKDNQPLSKRNALEEIACCYLYAKRNPSMLTLLAGHTDISGKAEYNDWLSEKRAENVLNILLGGARERDEWVKSVCSEKGGLAREGTPAYATQKRPDGKSKVEDYQMILKWVAGKFGWSSCDPGWLRDDWPASPGRTKKAIEAFQASYNNEEYVGGRSVREIVGGTSIKPNGFMNRETWGAFWDIYMLELAEQLGLYKAINKSQIPNTSRLQNYWNALKFIADNRRIVKCGEIHRITRLYKSRTDRRVEILFFEPKEKPKLDFYPHCHEDLPFDIERTKPGSLERLRAFEKRDECELYGNPPIYQKNPVTCDLDHTLIIRVLDCEGNPKSGVPVNIDEVGGGTETGNTDASGVLIHNVKNDGNFKVYVNTQNRTDLKGLEGVEEEIEIKK